MRHKIIFILLFLPMVVFAASDNLISHYQLKNGLQLFVKVNKRAPVVISQVFYKVGSSYEQNGTTGISHVLEHMMFQGTEKYPKGKLNQLIAQHGGMQNAMTGYDLTVYFQKLPAKYLWLSFELEADRMANLKMSEQNFQREMKVVKEEKRMRVDSNPQALTVQHFMSTAHVSNPYHHPTIGWLNDLNNLTVKDAQHWYDQWYAPNNAVVVVVGDVKPEKVYALAEKYFGPLKAKQIPVLKPRREQKPSGERRVSVRAPAKVPFLVMGYNTPTYKTVKEKWKVYALVVLSAVLGGSDSARLQSQLVRGKQIAASASTDYDPFQLHSDVLAILAMPAPGHTMEQLKKAVLQQVKKVRTTPVSVQELNRVKAQVLSGKIYEEDSIIRQAMNVGMLEAIGLPWKLNQTFFKHIQLVTAKQVQMVAKEYLTKSRLTIATLKPLNIKG